MSPDECLRNEDFVNTTLNNWITPNRSGAREQKKTQVTYRNNVEMIPCITLCAVSSEEPNTWFTTVFRHRNILEYICGMNLTNNCLFWECMKRTIYFIEKSPCNLYGFATAPSKSQLAPHLLTRIRVFIKWNVFKYQRWANGLILFESSRIIQTMYSTQIAKFSSRN